MKWRPFFDIDPVSEFDRFFEGFSGSRQGFVPPIDVYQTDNEVKVETPLPGVDPDEVKISIENDVLIIEGRSDKKKEVDEKNYYLREVRSGSFHRSVALPTAVEGDKAQAEYEQGILKVIIPKAERVKPKTIQISVKK